MKNRFAADDFRRLQNNFQLMLQLLLADNGRGWRSFYEDSKKIEAVTAEDVQRVAQTYLKPERRAVILYYTKKAEGGTPAETDPLLEGLSEQERTQVQRMRGMIQQLPPEKAQQMLDQLEQAEAAAPPEKQKVLKAIKALLQQKVKGA